MTTPAPTICHHCTDRLHHHLTTIPHLYTALNTDLVKGAPAEGARRKVSGSPALMRLEVLALMSPRTRWDGERGQPRYIPDRFGYWAHRLGRDTGIHTDITTLPQATDLLVVWFQTVTRMSWAAAIVDELDDLGGQLDRVLGEDDRDPIECDLDCGRRTYRQRKDPVS